MQTSRAHRTMKEKQRMSVGSRGMGRGGTADAIARQTESDFQSDMVRMRNNNQAQLAAFKNQRNASLRQRNMRKSDMPPTYIPSTPIPPPSNAQYAGQIMGAVAQGLEEWLEPSPVLVWAAEARLPLLRLPQQAVERLRPRRLQPLPLI